MSRRPLRNRPKRPYLLEEDIEPYLNALWELYEEREHPSSVLRDIIRDLERQAFLVDTLLREKIIKPKMGVHSHSVPAAKKIVEQFKSYETVERLLRDGIPRVRSNRVDVYERAEVELGVFAETIKTRHSKFKKRLQRADLNLSRLGRGVADNFSDNPLFRVLAAERVIPVRLYLPSFASGTSGSKPKD